MAWDGLLGLLEYNAAAVEAERAEEDSPTVCPLDGERLRVTPDGDRVCPLGNYAWP